MTQQKSICLNFEVHQPCRLRLYRFFDIGKDSHYYNDFGNRTYLRKLVEESYLPMNAVLLELVRKYDGKLRLSFSISGSALEQLERYHPEVIDSFKALAATGYVEFQCETYYHSLSALSSTSEFRHQVLKHRDAIRNVLGVTPTVFHNTELIYSDAIGAQLSDMGFRTVITEGAKNVLGWRSPNYVYNCDLREDQKILLRNYSLSDDLGIRFSNKDWASWPLTAGKYATWLRGCDGDVVNLFFDYETFGYRHPASSGIFDFVKALPDAVLADGTMQFSTPSEAAAACQSVGNLSIPDPISCAGVESDVSAWLGNELQQDAFNKLYSLTEKLSLLGDPVLWADFGHLTESDHFFYMSTKFFASGDRAVSYNPYDTPYEAFINYMNVLNDFTIRVDNRLAESEA